MTDSGLYEVTFMRRFARIILNSVILIFLECKRVGFQPICPV